MVRKAEAGRRREVTIDKGIKVTFEETGEFRSPDKGEWFVGDDGSVVQAKLAFVVRQFPILKMVL